MASSRMIVTILSLAASASAADARHATMGDPSAVPLPVERPFMIESPPLTIKMKRPPQARAGRPDEGAKAGGAGAPAPSRTAFFTEPPAPSPGMRKAVATEGPRESPAPTLSDLVIRHARDNGVPVELANAVIRIESRGNPLAAHRGALGLMQIKPGTARAVGFSGGASGLLVADTNLRYGMKVLGQAFRTSGGDICRALMLYQSGHLASHMSATNRAYCSKARAFMAKA